ncbi:hypothetical protein B0H13DRAFT_1898973 [Mycena leptocephala]|nr:hypothetical protein B0H13DRAFT_1898973 [Mycena leptocephala]
MLSSHFLSWKERNELAKDFLEQKPPDVLQPELNAPVPGAIVSNLRPNPSVIRDRVIDFWEEMQNTWTSTETQGSQNRDAYLNPLEVRWPTFHSISDITFKVTFAVGTSQTKLSESFARIRESEASLFRLGPLQVAGAPIQFKYTLDIMSIHVGVMSASGGLHDTVAARARALGHQLSRVSAVRVHCSLERGLCASDDTRIDHVDGPLDKTESVQGVQQQCGGPNARRPMTVTGSPACRVPERDNEDGAANWGGIGQRVGPAEVLSDTHIVEQGTQARAAACSWCKVCDNGRCRQDVVMADAGVAGEGQISAEGASLVVRVRATQRRVIEVGVRVQD